MSDSKYTRALITAILTVSIIVLSACGSGGESSLNGTYENKGHNSIYEFNSGSGVIAMGGGGPVIAKFDYKVKGDKVIMTMEDGKETELILKDGNIVRVGGMRATVTKIK